MDLHSDKSIKSWLFTLARNAYINHYRKQKRLKVKSERIEYLAMNGVQHYGVVITGPNKIMIELQNEEIVSYLEIDEIDFWIW